MSSVTMRAPARVSQARDAHERHAALQDALHSRVMRAIATGDGFTDIPMGCELWLLPDDDPNHVFWLLREATEAVIPGRNIYLRWVHIADLPVLELGGKPADAIRRVEYRADGSVERVWAPDGDGWREVEATSADRAGLPPVANG